MDPTLLPSQDRRKTLPVAEQTTGPAREEAKFVLLSAALFLSMDNVPRVIDELMGVCWSKEACEKLLTAVDKRLIDLLDFVHAKLNGLASKQGF